MIAAKNEWCSICRTEHIEGNHIEQECEDCKTLGAICDMRTYPKKEIYDVKSVYDSIVRYEKGGYDSGYIHIAIKERIKKELNIK